MTLPTDLEIQQHLVPVRASVLHSTTTVRSPRRSTRYRVTRNVLIAAVAVAALTAGALAVSKALQSNIDHSATCFQHASLDSHQQMIAGSGSTTDEGLDPIAGCQQAWLDHLLDPSGPNTVDPPELIVCTLPDSTAGVFPREGRPAEDFCETLGLADWDSD